MYAGPDLPRVGLASRIATISGFTSQISAEEKQALSLVQTITLSAVKGTFEITWHPSGKEATVCCLVVNVFLAFDYIFRKLRGRKPHTCFNAQTCSPLHNS